MLDIKEDCIKQIQPDKRMKSASNLGRMTQPSDRARGTAKKRILTVEANHQRQKTTDTTPNMEPAFGSLKEQDEVSTKMLGTDCETKMKTALSQELIKELPSYQNDDSEEQNDSGTPLPPKANYELISDTPSNANRFYQRRHISRVDAKSRKSTNQDLEDSIFKAQRMSPNTV